MSRIAALDPTTATGEAKTLLDGVKTAFGIVPNLFRVEANAPKLLGSHLTLNGNLSQGRIGGKTGERIALAVAAVNGCEYCDAAHSFIGAKQGLSGEEIALNREGRSTDPKAAAAVRFARAVTLSRGNVSDSDLADVRAAGFDDGEILEIVGHVVLNTLTNYVNNVARTVVDFPKTTATAA